MKKVNNFNFDTAVGRLITVDGIRYKWFCGSSYVTCRSEAGVKFCDTAANVKGITNSDWERGQRKRSGDGMVTPQEVSAWIRGKELERLKQLAPARVQERIRKNKQRELRDLPLFGWN